MAVVDLMPRGVVRHDFAALLQMSFEDIFFEIAFWRWPYRSLDRNSCDRLLSLQEYMGVG